MQGAPEPADQPSVTLPVDRLYVLEMWGAPPPDTTVAFRPGRARTVVLRHGPPDNTVFVELAFPADLFADSTGDSVRLAIQLRPGAYGLTVTTSKSFAGGATLRFKYPVHFAAPAEARQKYGNTVYFEQALRIGHQQDDGQFKLLPSARPASDNLQAEMPGPGTYIVAAPK